MFFCVFRRDFAKGNTLSFLRVKEQLRFTLSLPCFLYSEAPLSHSQFNLVAAITLSGAFQGATDPLIYDAFSLLIFDVEIRVSIKDHVPFKAMVSLKLPLCWRRVEQLALRASFFSGTNGKLLYHTAKSTNNCKSFANPSRYCMRQRASWVGLQGYLEASPHPKPKPPWANPTPTKTTQKQPNPTQLNPIQPKTAKPFTQQRFCKS